MAAPRKPVAVDAAKLAAELQAKLEAADQRRRACLAEKVEKATSTSPPKTPPKPKAPCLQEKLDAASARRQLFLDERVTKASDMASPSKAPKPAPEALKAAHDAMIADHGARHDHEIEQRVAKAHVASAKVARAEQKRAPRLTTSVSNCARRWPPRRRRAAALRAVVGKAATEDKLQAAKARKAALAQDASAAGDRRPHLSSPRPVPT